MRSLAGMRPAAAVCLFACAAALGALVVGRVLVLPELSAQPELVDANLAKTLTAPMHARLAEVVFAAHLVIAALAGRCFGKRWPTTVGLILVAGSALHRFALLPALYAAYARADLVAGRPIDQLIAADRLELQELALVGAMVVLLSSLLIAASRRLGTPAAPAAAPAPVPTAEPVPEPA